MSDWSVAGELIARCLAQGLHVHIGKTGPYRADRGSHVCIIQDAHRTAPSTVAYSDDLLAAVTEACAEKLSKGLRGKATT